MTNIYSGIGYDVHRLSKGNGIWLGGIWIPCEFSAIAHSDGDVLIHSIIDSMLGACSLGDIGCYFPDDDDRYSGCSGVYLLRETLNIIQNKFQVRILNIDSTIVMQKPKLGHFRHQISKNLSDICGANHINTKFKTEENLGFTGSSEGIKSLSLTSIEIL